MRRVVGFTGVKVLTYALVTNHIHILVEEPDCRVEIGDDELLERLMCLYGEVGVREITERWELWLECGEGDAVEEDKDGMALQTIAAYVEMNPVRAGLVDDPKAYRFCGFGEAMGYVARKDESAYKIDEI
ncbi:MAG: hypothetical protein EOL87_16240 [Spartobacteria bacterium]|nr:hypothetical protein [Spartobacteria bacterium]